MPHRRLLDSDSDTTPERTPHPLKRRRLLDSDSDTDEPPTDSTPPPEPTAKPTKRAAARLKHQLSRLKFRKREYMKPPHVRSRPEFAAYFAHMHAHEKASRTLERFKRFDERMQRLRETQRRHRAAANNAGPRREDYACHVCGDTPATLLQCQMPISNKLPWRGRPPPRHSYATWWREARAAAERWALSADRARGVFAVLKSHWLQYKRARTMDELAVAYDATHLDFLADFYSPAPFLRVPPRPAPSLASATLATLAFEQQCARYICKRCCVRERMPRNLEASNDSFCRTCYHRGTRLADYARYKRAHLETAALAYRERRPRRAAPPERPLPSPSTLLTDRSVNALWVGGTGRQLIYDEPLNGARYSHSEINGLLKTVENFFYNCTTDLQVLYHVEQDLSRPWDLTRAECLHHFGPAALEVLSEHFDEQAELVDPHAEPDEEGDSDCELMD